MLSLRGLWNRHKRKVLISIGVVGSGYFIYNFYYAHKRRVLDLERQLEHEREAEELIRTQLETHFENIQRISDTMTLPHAMHHLGSRIAEEIDVSHLTEKLMQGKGQSGGLSSKEKLELWDRIKILSFTRAATSLWSMTMLCLYVRVQVNILGRQLYLEVAGLESSNVLDEADSFSRHGQHDFLETANFLSTYGIGTLIGTMQNAAIEVLKGKQLVDPFSTTQLRETIAQMLDLFKTSGAPNYWITYLVPESATEYRQLMVASFNGSDGSSILMDTSKLEQLMLETREVLSSPGFANMMDIALRKVLDMVVEEDIGKTFVGVGPSSVPLAKLLPRVALLGPSLLEDPSSNKFVQSIWSLPEVQLFYTLLYTNIQPSAGV